MKRQREENLIKYFICIQWILSIIVSVIQYGAYKTINPFLHIENYIN